MVGRHEREVRLVLVIGVLRDVRHLEEVVLVHFRVDVERGLVEAAVAGAHHVRVQHARSEDALARVGEHEVVADALRQGQLAVAHRIRSLVEASGDRKRRPRVGEAFVKCPN